MVASVEHYRFTPDLLKVPGRKPGISAFMRIRNGADFLETTIRSHAPMFDEIVAVYNQCTDATPEILARLAAELGPDKLKVFHYLDRVFPPGSDGHIKTDPASPQSIVTYSNFALAQTTRQVAVKLDDDHLAMPDDIARVTATIRAGLAPHRMLSFSGINLVRDRAGRLAIPAHDPISGSGDIGFFTVTPETVFTFDNRFERAPRQGLTREFCGFLYWHLKYLKTGLGFANYELDSNPKSRFAAKKAAMAADRLRVIDLPTLIAELSPGLVDRLAARVIPKRRLILDRNSALGTRFDTQSLEAAVTGSSGPDALSRLVPRG